MVRFKNRHILVEFLQPHLMDPSFSASSFSTPNIDLEVEDEEDVLPLIPDIPFLLPLPSVNGAEQRLKLGDEGGGSIYRAIRNLVQEVYGDEGWGRIASSFKGISTRRFGRRYAYSSRLSLLFDHFDDHTCRTRTLSPLMVGHHPSDIVERSTSHTEGNRCQWDYQEIAECSDCIS